MNHSALLSNLLLSRDRDTVCICISDPSLCKGEGHALKNKVKLSY